VARRASKKDEQIREAYKECFQMVDIEKNR